MMIFRPSVCFRVPSTPFTSTRKPWLNDVQYQKFTRLLARCRLHSLSESGMSPRSGTCRLPPNAAAMMANPAYAVFAPLFSPFFDFHQQQLTTLGDVIIDRYLSDKLAAYSMHSGLILTVNAAKQWNAVFHNHFSLRLFANELQFGELAIPLSHDFQPTADVASSGATSSTAASGDEPPKSKGDDSRRAGGRAADARAAMVSCLSRLEARRSGPSRRDVAGTSFASNLLSCGQSPLGWKFSHFIGAVHQVFGPPAATTALETLYGLEGDAHLMDRAASFLMRVLEYYPAMNVAEAILAAQGMPVTYRGKTRVLGVVEAEERQQQQQENHNNTEDATRASSSPSPPPTTGGGSSNEMAPSRSEPADAVPSQSAALSRLQAEQRRRSVALLALSGFGQPSAPSVTLDTLLKQCGQTSPAGSGASDANSLLDGPEGVEMVRGWRERAAQAQGLVHSSSAMTRIEDHPSEVTDGWLSPEDQWTSQSGPAFANAIDVARHRSFADAYGPADPENGKVVARIPFKRPVRDPLFYDKLSDMRGGVPLDVEGQGSTEGLLSLLQKPHRRLFEVSMFVGPPAEGRVIGRAIAWRYGVARDAAAKAFLSGVLQDLRRYKINVTHRV